MLEEFWNSSFKLLLKLLGINFYSLCIENISQSRDMFEGKKEQFPCEFRNLRNKGTDSWYSDFTDRSLNKY